MDELSVKRLLYADGQVILALSACGLQEIFIGKQEDLLTYYQHLDALHADFTERFLDILNMNLPSWILDSSAKADTAESLNLEEILVELTINEKLKIKKVPDSVRITNESTYEYLTRVKSNRSQRASAHRALAICRHHRVDNYFCSRPTSRAQRDRGQTPRASISNEIFVGAKVTSIANPQRKIRRYLPVFVLNKGKHEPLALLKKLLKVILTIIGAIVCKRNKKQGDNSTEMQNNKFMLVALKLWVVINEECKERVVDDTTTTLKGCPVAALPDGRMSDAYDRH
ncbi:hypothetical protein EVAR_47866_1 [Eumeta japonica]|uniref:Uncharacterized protein n=1 Tax=Eumeta variegata TaxID=151549 RepID=A0A4C1ZYL6_EUMVA|nr:hypothetical protein EVAR_47866_1 [Eumeta japonica]